MKHRDDNSYNTKLFNKKSILTILGIFIAVCLFFMVKPIRRIIMTYPIRFLSSIGNSEIDETPNIQAGELSIQTIDKDNEQQNYIWIEKEPYHIHKGSLILVDSTHAYKFLDQDQLVSLNKNKNKCYKIMDKDMKLSRIMLQFLNNMMKDFEKNTGKHDMIITSAYRNLMDQEMAFDEKINEFGEAEAVKWVMLPGYSEHHTGYAIDMCIYTDDDIYVAYKGQNEYAWINQNCFKYGIIRRYTDEKVPVTGISNEPWHYRYVGIPHAYLMTIHQFCLEEYLEYIRQYDFAYKHLYIATEEGRYEIYYVPADPVNTTKVPVPKKEIYSISGNNIDGYIVTVYLDHNKNMRENETVLQQ